MAKAQILLEAEPLRLLEVPQLVQTMGNIAEMKLSLHLSESSTKHYVVAKKYFN